MGQGRRSGDLYASDVTGTVFFRSVFSRTLPRAGALATALVVVVPALTAAQTAISFSKSMLQGESLNAPTSLQFGPDDRLYVSQQNGTIFAYTVSRTPQGNYVVTDTEQVNLVKNIQNHNDDGTPNSNVKDRLVTGILVAGTAQNPVVYVTSSDPRIGGGANSNDKNLDTNSGIVSRLRKSGSSWTKFDLVRGLPRSEENHGPNGMALSQDGETLYVAVGGHTNMGAPSNNFVFLPEYALSAAILEIDIDDIEGDGVTYDLPTLDDETRSGGNDANDPFGGNNGKNQARLVPGGPVQVYAPGFRNSYDLVITQNGRMFATDNGPNSGWGDLPAGEGTDNCTNAVRDPGTTYKDQLHRVPARGYYGGHPNPTRGRKANTFNSSNPQSPVATSNSVECDYRTPGNQDGALVTFSRSTNGIAEYTASNFGGQLRGDLLLASFDNNVWRIQLNSAGTSATKASALFSSVGADPLDITMQGDSGIFPGTVWVADHELDGIIIFEPADLDTCSGADDEGLDEDDDGYDNHDEIENGTDPCSAADVPPDFDGDGQSNINDRDDDNDGYLDFEDPFAIDATNGFSTPVPFFFGWENDDPFVGGLLDLGFTGLMTNYDDGYAFLYDPDEMTTGGAAGVVTVDGATEGDAYGANNDQEYGFQVGVTIPPGTDEVTAHTRVVAPFLGIDPEPNQSLGLFVGNGDQDNYFKVVIAAGAGDSDVIECILEIDGSVTLGASHPVVVPGPAAVDLYIGIDRVARTVRAGYSISDGGFTGDIVPLGGPLPIPVSWLEDPVFGLAVGIISTSRGPGTKFPASWDLLELSEVTLPPPTTTTTSTTTTTTTLITTTTSTTTTTLVPPTSTTTLPGGTTTTTEVPPSSTTTSTTLPPGPLCGDIDGNGRITASDALAALRTAIGLATCELCNCDINGNGVVGATDAFAILNVAVGNNVELQCAACDG